MTEIDPERMAVVLMDYQPAVLQQTVHGDPEPFLMPAARLSRVARAARATVIFVRVAFRSGYPEIADANRNFARIRDSRLLQDGDGDAAIHPALDVDEADIVVTKHRTGAFLGTDLEQVLRARQITALALGGVATSGSVLSTLTAAADRDYRLVVLSDCCSDPNETVHRALMEQVFPLRAEVVRADEFGAALKGA